jgi:hypothetical protein
MSKGEQMMREILSKPERSYDGVFLNDLLEEFQKGYSVDRLRDLLSSDDDRLVRSGAFIVSELGASPAPLLREIAKLLDHPAKRVRGDAIICVLQSATQCHGAEIAKVVTMLGDAESGVRWEVMQFLGRATIEQLRAGLMYLESADPDSSYLPGLRWLVNKAPYEPDEIKSLLRGNDSYLRKYAAAAAARTARLNREPLLLASMVEDGDVSDFAKSWLESIGSA